MTELNKTIEDLTADDAKDTVEKLQKEIAENEELLVKANTKIETLEKDILGGGKTTEPLSKEEKEKIKKELKEKLK